MFLILRRTVAASLALTLGQISTAGAAEAGLPYIGRTQNVCNVIEPKDPLNGGFLTDENCTTIYVLPPKFGVAEIGSYARYETLKECESIDKRQSAHFSLLNNLESSSLKAVGLEQELENLVDMSQYDRLMEQLRKLTEFATALDAYINIKRSQFENLYSIQAATVNIVLQSPWDRLTRAYAEANSRRLMPMAVRRIPLISGHLTYDMHSENKQSNGLGDLLSGNLRAVTRTSRSLLGVRVTDEGPNAPKVGDTPDETNPEEPNTFHFSNSAGISMELTALAACSLTDIRKELRMDATQSPVAFLAPNFTFFYPVASKAIYKVEINGGLLSTTVQQQISQGKIDSDDLMLALRSSGSGVEFKETTESDLQDGNTITAEERKALKDQLIEYLTETILKNIGQITKSLEAKHRVYSNTVHETQSCSRKWYGARRCSTHRYTVTVSKPDWKLIAEKLEKIVNQPVSGSISSQRTYRMSGTMTFLPPEKIKTLKLDITE